ncbi:MAG: GNAT family N-acetyltransferase [Anaerolineae bacterium]
MQPISVRPTLLEDLPLLAAIWHEKMTILASTDRRFMPSAQMSEQWQQDAQQWLHDSSCCLLTACTSERAIGFALGTIMPKLAGFSAEQSGIVTQMAIDAHGYYGGAGRLLIDALRDWFGEKQVGRILVLSSHRYPAEQAFWRALGAVDWMDMLWLK